MSQADAAGDAQALDDAELIRPATSELASSVSKAEAFLEKGMRALREPEVVSSENEAPQGATLAGANCRVAIAFFRKTEIALNGIDLSEPEDHDSAKLEQTVKKLREQCVEGLAIAHNQLAPSNDAVRDLEINFKALLRRMRIMDVAYLKVLKADEHGDDAGKVEQVQASFTISGGKRLDTTLHEIQGLMHETGLEPGAENLSDVTTRYSIWVLDLVQQYPFAPKSEDKRKTFKGEILSYQQIRSKVHEGATLTADYIVFTVCAGIISAVGLGRDDFVATVASMLVSPLMGPILGITFGFWENDVQLVLRSLRNEFIGLVLCIVVGLITGLVVAEWAEDDWDWPTEFMSSRGEPMSLAVGLAIAIPSGAGVARSITTANAGGLIGVAISASLLPPTVNAGMCWAVAAFSDDEHRAIARTGGYSLLLTIVNIMAIILAALVAWYFQLRRLKEQWGQRAGAEVYSTNALRRDEAEQLKAKYTAQRTSEAERPIDEDAEGKRPIDGDADTESYLKSELGPRRVRDLNTGFVARERTPKAKVDGIFPKKSLTRRTSTSSPMTPAFASNLFPPENREAGRRGLRRTSSVTSV